MSHFDEDPTFFERERDRLSREITSVSRSSPLTVSHSLSPGCVGLRGAPLFDQRPQSETRRGARNDERVRYHRRPMAQLLSPHERSRTKGRVKRGTATRFAWHRRSRRVDETVENVMTITRKTRDSILMEHTGIQVQGVANMYSTGRKNTTVVEEYKDLALSSKVCPTGHPGFECQSLPTLRNRKQRTMKTQRTLPDREPTVVREQASE